MIEIPLTSEPEQLFSVIIGGETYNCRVMINSRTKIWSISFSKEGVPIVTGISLLSGVDLIKRFNIPIKNMYIVNLDNPSLDPSNSDLGTVSKLFILTDEEVTNG